MGIKVQALHRLAATPLCIAFVYASVILVSAPQIWASRRPESLATKKAADSDGTWIQLSLTLRLLQRSRIRRQCPA